MKIAKLFNFIFFFIFITELTIFLNEINNVTYKNDFDI